MATLFIRNKWRMLNFIWRYQKELTLAVIVAMAVGLVVVISMEPGIPSMTEMDLSPAKQRKLIDDLVKERQQKWEQQGFPPEFENHRNFEDQPGKDTDNNADEYYDDSDSDKDEQEEYELDFLQNDKDNWLNLQPQKESDHEKDVPELELKTKKAPTKLPRKPTLKYEPFKKTIIRMKDSPLEGGKAQCIPYNVKNNNISGVFDCITLKVKPPTPICLYPDDMDIHVSRTLRRERIWEPHMVLQFQNFLYGDASLGVIDIGANIGQYSLIAAAMNHTVVSVEPFSENLRLFHKAISIGGFQNRITVVQNAISDSRQHLKLYERKDNQGGVALKDVEADPWCPESECGPHAKTIFMDDLLEVINFDKAVLKIDIEGHEHRAFAQSEKLLEEVYVPYIMMEWIKLREYYGAEIDQSEDKTLTHNLVKYLTQKGYSAYSFVTGVKLKPDYWYAWADDVLWKHELADLV